MKKIYLFLILSVLSYASRAQCMATMDVVSSGNDVTVTINGTGAAVPGYGIVWGDGLEDQVQSATHTYAAPGTYQICFLYFDQADIIGCNQTACQDVIITGSACTLDFTPMTLGSTVSVDAVATGASTPYFTITWGDGSLPEYNSTGTHTYAADGTYPVCVTMMDQDNPDNCTLNLCYDVVIAQNSGACSVVLTTSISGASVTATGVGSGALTENYIINWGDGSYDMTGSATHAYATTGTYDICVVYGDFGPGGCSSTDCETVTITDLGSCVLDIVPTMSGLTVVLTGNASGATTPEITIDWGDGTPTSNSLPATHTYAAAGNYQICASYVDLANIENCQIVSCVDVTATDPTSNCTVDITVTVTGNNVAVSATGTGAESPQYVITWGDGSFPTLSNNGTHNYATPGAYTVCVVYTDLNNTAGCAANACEDITIVVGVEENILGENSVRVLPNPLAEISMINLQLNRPSHVEVSLFDLTGKKVTSIFNGERGQGFQTITLNTAEIASGVYFLQVVAGEEERTIRVMK